VEALGAKQVECRTEDAIGFAVRGCDQGIHSGRRRN
jgi:hypothetical protein